MWLVLHHVVGRMATLRFIFVLLMAMLCIGQFPTQSASLGKSTSSPNKIDWNAIRAMINPKMLEGDILVRKKKPQIKLGTVAVGKDRNAVGSDSYIWPNGVIPYAIDPAFDSTQRQLIQKAMDHISKHTCIKFRAKTDADFYYITIVKGNGCYASIGRDPDFPQGIISLGSGCYYMGTVVHELMHTIGYYHEHNRHDRDSYLRIYWENIQEEHKDEFKLMDPRNERIFTAFDYNSVMLYGPRAFSKDSHSITMEPKLSGYYMIEVYEKPGLTKLDAESINKLYKCPSK